MAKTTREKKAPAASNGVTDIPHEEVLAQPGTISQVPKIMSVDDQIKNEIAKFNLAESGIAALKETYGSLTIAGTDDKAGYKAVREAWAEVRNKRTGLEKKGLELRNGFAVITKAIKKEEDRLVELLEPLEEDLHKKWKAIDEEKDRQQREKEEEEKRQLMVRVEEVLGLGMTFQEGFYCIGETISMDVATLRALPDDQYEKLKTSIKAKAAEILKEQEAEAERKRLEAERLQKEKDDLAAEQEKMRLEREQLQREKDELETQKKEAAKVKAENRTNKLLSLGMARTGTKFVYNNDWNEPFDIVQDLVFAMDEAQFGEYVTSASAMITEQKASKDQHQQEVKKEAEEKERREKNISAHMERIGMTYNYTLKIYEFKNDHLSLSVSWDQLLPLTDDLVENWADNALETIEKAKANQVKSDNEKKAKEEREEKLAQSDSDRYKDEIRAIEVAALKMIPGEYKTKKFQNKAQAVLEQITKILNSSK